MEICDWESMTKDEFLIHLFAEGCSDITMSKLAMEVLSSKKPTVAELRSKIAETENLLWYGNNRNLNMVEAHLVLDLKVQGEQGITI